MRGDLKLHARFQQAPNANDEVILSPMVIYEVQRGLLAKSAAGQMRNFERLIIKLGYVEFDRTTWEKATSGCGPGNRATRYRTPIC